MIIHASAIGQNRVVRTKLFSADNDPGTPETVVVVAVVHHVSWVAARADPSKAASWARWTLAVVHQT